MEYGCAPCHGNVTLHIGLNLFFSHLKIVLEPCHIVKVEGTHFKLSVV